MKDGKYITNKKLNIRLHNKAIILFFLTFMLCSLLALINVLNRMNVEKLTMEQLIIEKSVKANDILSRLLYKTQILSTLVVNNNGEVDNFEQIARMVVDDPSILNILIAPEGVVSSVYPLKGNEAVIGLDYFSEGAGNREALSAKETGRLVFGGPFNAIQGGQILVGRLPVFLNDSDGDEYFWGIVSVTLKYPQALDGTGLNELLFQGFAYEIWRINPDDGEKQVITSSGVEYSNGMRFIEKHIKIQDADWYFRIMPVRAWYQYPDTWVLILLGFCISLLVAYVMQSNSELKLLKTSFEKLSHTDSLTGIHNRRHFMNCADKQIERVKQTTGNAFIIILDIDHFKKINDQFGHSVGDEVLKDIAYRVKGLLQPNDLFSRYGGEEFTILVTDIDKQTVQNLAERIKLNIANNPVRSENTLINVTASFGISNVLLDSKIEKSIMYADKALYEAKNKGRNKVVFYENNELEV